jgi:DNA (cytosine-5)-methyltransferase 1
MIKLLELFGGIGAVRRALERKDIDFKTIDYVEIDKFAVKSYNVMFDEEYKPQDVTNWNKKIEVDMIAHGSPCQDFSLAGNQAGGEEGSGTRSSLLFETVRIVKNLKPNYVIWENVKNAVGKKHKHVFDKYLNYLESLGYTNHWKVLNSTHYGIPQNRERVFCISILGDRSFIFPKNKKLLLKLKDLLQDNPNSKFNLSQIAIKKLVRHNNKIVKNMKNPKISSTIHAGYYKMGGRDQQYIIKVPEKYYLSDKMKKYIMAKNEKWTGNNNGAIVNKSIASTINTGEGIFLDQLLRGKAQNGHKDFNIRKLTPRECWRLQGFDDYLFERAEKVCSNTQLYKQAGNSITVNVLEYIFEELFNLKYRDSLIKQYAIFKELNMIDKCKSIIHEFKEYTSKEYFLKTVGTYRESSEFKYIKEVIK